MITLTINNNPGTGTLAGTTAKFATLGEASFADISIDNPGVGYTLDAVAAGLTIATSNAFTINAVPTQFIITGEPSDTDNGSLMAPAITVEIRDALNNLVTDATNNVTLAFGTDPSGGSATIGGTITVAAVGGIATFSDIEIDEVQTGYTFDFTSTGLTSATSILFDITQAPATQLVITGEPTNAVAGVDITPSDDN